MLLLPAPINIQKWVSENGELLKPPVGNYCAYKDDHVTVMIVGGPNERQDFHINQTPEWFYMYKGQMVLKVVEDGKHRDIPIGEGDMFLLPPNTPHSPQRYADSIGLVLETARPEGMNDTLQWYCDSCGEIVYKNSFHMVDLGTQVKEGVEAFWSIQENRTCKHCGSVKERIGVRKS